MKKLIKLFIRIYLKTYYKLTINKGSLIHLPIFSLTGGHRIKIGENSTIGKKAWISAISNYGVHTYSPNIIIGNYVNIGNYACIASTNKIAIFDGTLISEHFYISDHYHGFDPNMGRPADQMLYSKGNVIIGENCFIGYRVTILSGVTLGRNCVVGSHAVVTTSFPDYSMIAGVPAKLIKKYNIQTNNWEKVN